MTQFPLFEFSQKQSIGKDLDAGGRRQVTSGNTSGEGGEVKQEHWKSQPAVYLWTGYCYGKLRAIPTGDTWKNYGEHTSESSQWGTRELGMVYSFSKYSEVHSHSVCSSYNMTLRLFHLRARVYASSPQMWVGLWLCWEGCYTISEAVT